MKIIAKIKRSTLLLGLFAAMVYSPIHANDKYKDVWWNPAMSGMGFNLTQIGSFLFGYWYTFAEDGSPTYFTFGGTVINNALVSPLYRSTGTSPGPGYDAARVSTVPAGEMRLDFNPTNSNRAVFNYTYGTNGGTINLERFSFLDNSATLNGVFQGVTYGLDIFINEQTTFTITVASGRIKIVRDSFFSGVCQFEGPFTLAGAAINAAGTYRCSDFSEGTFTADRLRVLDEGVYVGTITKQASGTAVSSQEIHFGK